MLYYVILCYIMLYYVIICYIKKSIWENYLKDVVSNNPKTYIK